MKDHVKSIVRAASFAIYRIGKLRHYLNRKSVECLVHAFVSSRLDSCNALLYGLQDYQTAKLQRVQNSAARLITRCWKREHMKLVLSDLHWLPVKQRIWYKIALLLRLPKITKTNFYGNRAFASASSNVWNTLPTKLHAMTNIESFKRNLKTHLFNLS